MLNHFYAVIGDPVSHSLSPKVYQLFAKQTQRSIFYEKKRVQIEQFDETLDELRAQGLKGANITVPFKSAAFLYADKVDKVAKEIGAASAMKFNEDGISIAVNYDGMALTQDLTNNLNWQLKDKHILILGAGGAVRGILPSLLAQSPASIVIVNRTVIKAQELADKFSKRGNIQAIDYKQLKKEAFDLVINGTSASLSNELPPLTAEVIASNTACYDLAYASKPTVFLAWAQKQGCKQCSDGIGMLIEHNAKCFHLWFGIHPLTESVIKQLKTKN